MQSLPMASPKLRLALDVFSQIAHGNFKQLEDSHGCSPGPWLSSTIRYPVFLKVSTCLRQSSLSDACMAGLIAVVGAALQPPNWTAQNLPNGLTVSVDACNAMR